MLYNGDDDPIFQDTFIHPYDRMNERQIVSDVERRIASIKIQAQRGLVRWQIDELLDDLYLASGLSEYDRLAREIMSLEGEGKKGEARRFLEAARARSAHLETDHQVWKMESFLRDVVLTEQDESDDDWRKRAYPILGTSIEEIEGFKKTGSINQARMLLKAIRLFSEKAGVQSLSNDEKYHLAACLCGLEASLSRAGKNLNSIGARREELRVARDVAKGVTVQKSSLVDFSWVLSEMPNL